MQKKVKSMYTDPDHLRVQDPGKLEGNTVFTYLDAFCRPEHFGLYLPEYPNLDELKAHYQRGGSGRYESEEVPQRNYAGDTGAYPQPPQGV